jgi:Domain of unknown function (DUF6265)
MVLSILLWSCAENHSHSSGDMKFDLKQLSGVWLSEVKDEMTNTGASSVEVWQMIDEGKMVGSDLVIFNQADTIIIANLKIQKKDTIWMNEVAVNPKTNPVPVPFKLVSSSEKEMKFQNTGQGSPEMICYQLLNPNKLLVYLESSSKNGNNRTEFHYQRAKQ